MAAIAATLEVPAAYAYLDPGSGGLLLQLFFGGLAGLAVVVRLYWHRLLVLLKIKESPPPEPDADSDSNLPDQS
jgi:hypothetical protein